MVKTERRKQWEESLPERNKMLRLQLQVLKDSIKRDKMTLHYVKKEENIKFLKRSINAQKVIIRAVKHELQRAELSKPTYRLNKWGVYEGPTCSICGGRIEEGNIEVDEDEYCHLCGHTINWKVEVREGKN